MRQKCVICDVHPAHKGSYCANCASKIEADGRNHNGHKPVKFLTYQGIVVGLSPNGKGTFQARLMQRSADHLPKSRTLDLNTYLDGFTREQVKAFKAACLSLAHA